MSAFPPKILHLSPKISDDLFFSHRPFSCLIWYFSKSVADIATGGGKNPYFSTKSQYYHCSFYPGGGAKLHCQFRWGGHGRICPPGSATEYCSTIIINHGVPGPSGPFREKQ